VAGACLAAVALLLAGAARADLVSPGELSRPHAQLEGIANCTKCHAAGQKLTPERCLDCHKELAGRIAQGKGLHGRLADRACEGCHHEHQGASFALVDWGDAGQKGFDHAKAGWPLQGKHARVKCEACHDLRLVTEGAVKEVLGKGRKSLLGAPTACVACHFDDHRGQVGTDCAKCHGAEAWKPARGFDHQKTAYPLRGLHAKVACDKCHPRQVDPAGKGGFPAAVSETFLKLKPVPFQACTDCHKDPHQNRFGPLCTSCHVVEGWKIVKSAAGETATFHDKTRYPLRGAHAQVACKACHGPFQGQRKAVYKNMAFEACTDCHLDAHVGQLGKKGSPQAACDRCHVVQGWVPVRYELADHQKSKYPLEGAHRAVACDRCHVKDPRLEQRLLPSVRAQMLKQRRPAKASTFPMDRNLDTKRCTTCHKDVHQGQFQARVEKQGCQGCHDLSSWSQTRFDHGKDTKFPLEGKHARTACGSCHAAATARDGTAYVRYAGAPLACAKCHADPHAGQFARKGVTDCLRCHGLEEWKKGKFVHEPPFTTYLLTGKHVQVKCEACHPVAKVGKAEIRRYRGVPLECQGCHADFHKGAFRGFQP
jgi:hypothetical protein